MIISIQLLYNGTSFSCWQYVINLTQMRGEWNAFYFESCPNMHLKTGWLGPGYELINFHEQKWGLKSDTRLKPRRLREEISLATVHLETWIDSLNYSYFCIFYTLGKGIKQECRRGINKHLKLSQKSKRGLTYKITIFNFLYSLLKNMYVAWIHVSTIQQLENKARMHGIFL